MSGRGSHFASKRTVLAGMKPAMTMKWLPVGDQATSCTGPSFRLARLSWWPSTACREAIDTG